MGKIDGLENLKKMDYPGRAIILGKTLSKVPFAVYILTGRSESSKARTLEYDERNGVVYTKPTDRKKLEEGSPVLLLYPAIMPFEDGLTISNGAQTKLIYSHYMNNRLKTPLEEISPFNILSQSLMKPFFEYDKKLGLIDITSYEPDSNHTPRISGYIMRKNMMRKYSFIISKYDESYDYEVEEARKRLFVDDSPISGKAKIIATYNGIDTGTEPLQSFEGGPLEVRVKGKTPEEIAHEIRSALKDEYFIALACQFVSKKNKKPYIINQHN